MGGGAVDLHRAGTGLAVDHVGDETGAVVDVPNVDLLVGDQVGAGHQLGVDGDAADVIHIAVGHRRPVDLGLEHLPLHWASVSALSGWSVQGWIRTLSISRAPPTWAATAMSTVRPFDSATGCKLSASRASRYSGSTPAARSSARAASRPAARPRAVAVCSAARSARES